MNIQKISLRQIMEDDDMMIEQWALDAVAGAVDAAKAMQAEWGQPCPDFDPDCAQCRAWRVFGKATRRAVARRRPRAARS